MRRLGKALALALAVAITALFFARYFLGRGNDARRRAGKQLLYWLHEDAAEQPPEQGQVDDHPAAHEVASAGGHKTGHTPVDKQPSEPPGSDGAPGSMWLGNLPSKDLSAAEVAQMAAPPATPRASRRHDFVLCANVAGTLGSSLQAAKAFFTIASRLQQRGWRVRVVLPAVGGTEFDNFRLDEKNGTSLGRVLDLTPLRKLLDIDEDSGASIEPRKKVCWEKGCDVSVFSLVNVRNEQLRTVTVPHIWLGPGYERWMFEQLFDNLGTLANAPNFTDVIRVFWQMRSSSPTECSPFVYPDLAYEVGQAMRLKPPEQVERCAFVYVGPIIRRDRLWHLRPGPNYTQWCPQCSLPDLPAWVNATGWRIGSLLKAQQLTCANFYVRLLGLNSTEFLQLIHDGAAKGGVPFQASRIKKRPCRLCMESNMEILQRAAASPLLVAEYGSFWPDTPAKQVLARGATVAYLHGDVLARMRMSSLHEKASEAGLDPGRDLDTRNDVAFSLLSCKDGVIHRGKCIDHRSSATSVVQSHQPWQYDEKQVFVVRIAGLKTIPDDGSRMDLADISDSPAVHTMGTLCPTTSSQWLPHGGRAADRACGTIWLQVKPAVRGGANLFNDFSPQAAMMNLMQSIGLSIRCRAALHAMWVVGDVDDDEVDQHAAGESEAIYEVYKPLAELEERLQGGSSTDLASRLSEALATRSNLQRKVEKALEGLCVVGRFVVQSSTETSERVARAHLVVERGPQLLLNRVVRVYTLQNRNRARQGDEVWVELRHCVLDSAVMALRSGSQTPEQLLGYCCLFGRVLRAERALEQVPARTDYLCKQSQIQWQRGRLVFIPFSQEVPVLQVETDSQQQLPLDRVFRLRIVDWPVTSLRPKAQIVDSFRHPGGCRDSPESIVRLFCQDLEHALPEKPAAAASRPPRSVQEERRDLSNSEVFSIDSAGADMIDDALEFDEQQGVVRVHIADVAAFVKSGSPVDREAAYMGCSIYLRNHCDTVQWCRPMLPENITEAACLAKGQRRPALTFEFKMNRGRWRAGEVSFQQFFRSTVQLREAMSFEEAAQVLREDAAPGGVRGAMQALWDVTKKAMTQRLQTDEAYALRCPWLQDTGEASNARRLVEFWMTQVNECSGRLISARRTSVLQCLHCFPCPDGNHFSRLSMLCRDATFRALQREGHESLITKLHESANSCQESVAGVLNHALRLAASPTGAASWSTDSSQHIFGTEQCQAAAVFRHQLSQCVPPAYYLTMDGATPPMQWPLLQSCEYFQVTSPLRRWIDLLGQHLLVGSFKLNFDALRRNVHRYNEMHSFAKQVCSRYAFLTFCTDLLKSERKMNCVVSRVDQGSIQLACPEMVGFFRSIHIPLGLLASHDVAVRPVVEEKKALLCNVEDGQSVEICPFKTKMVAQLALDVSSPVALYRLTASAIFISLPNGHLLRHAILARQHPEVFGPYPDLRQARKMHSEGGLWGSVWEQVQLSRMCAAALMPRARAVAPYYMTTSCRGLPSQWFPGRRGNCVQVQVPACYRGLEGLHRLREGHLAIIWRSGNNQELWTGYGRVTHIDSTERMKRKTQLCWHYMEHGTCSQPDCWFAHGEDDIREELIKATITLSKCSEDSMPDWASEIETNMDVYFAAIFTHDLQSLKSIKDSANMARDHQRDGRKSIINRLLFKAGGVGGQAGWQDDEDGGTDMGSAEGLAPLNTFQQKGLDLALKEPLAYVQGPPGTGKSTTAAYLICHLLNRLSRQRKERPTAPSLLVCCPSNKACDRLLHLLLRTNIAATVRIVRVYARSIERSYWAEPHAQFRRDYQIDPELCPYALHEQVMREDADLYQLFQDIASQLKNAGARKDMIAERLKLHDALKQARQQKDKLSKQLLKQANVIFTTCDCASNDKLFEKMTYPAVVIDEAAQAVEFELASCCILAEEHLALFGDHLQLGPVLTETTLFPAFRRMFTRSLFERVVSKRQDRTSSSGIPHVTLKRQYRMHPSISFFASEEFYDNELVNASETGRDGYTLPSSSDSRLVVVDVTGPHGRRTVAPEGDAVLDYEHSLCNPAEAAVVVDYVRWLLSLGVEPASIAVITPYRAQAALITERLEGVSPMPTIGTVHLLQGEEREYVALSLVRSFAEADTEVFDPVPAALRRAGGHQLGFLKDRRLANVALTRAQLGLLVVGNMQVLSGALHWKNLVEHVKAENVDAYWTEEEARNFLTTTGFQAPSRGAARWEQDAGISGSESEGGDPEDSSGGGDEEERDPDDEPDAFEDPVPSASDAESADAPAAPPAEAKRQRRKGKKKKKSGKKAPPGQSEQQDQVLEEAVAAAASSSQSAQTAAAAVSDGALAVECVVRTCRRRPHKPSPFASQHGLCAEHWTELLKERDILQREFNGGTLLDRFLTPAYWTPNPPPVMLKEKQHSRPFFALLVRFLDDKTRPLHDHFATTFLLLSGLAFQQGTTAAELPARLALWTDWEPPPLTGLLFAATAVADCVAWDKLPAELQARWRRVEGTWDRVLRSEPSPVSGGREDIKAAHVEDILAVVMFWKHEGNECLKKKDFANADVCYRQGTVLIKGLPPEFVTDDKVSKAMELEADLLSNHALTLLKVDRPQEAHPMAAEAAEIFEELGPGCNAKLVKALFRCGSACMGQARHTHGADACEEAREEAREHFTEALRLDPANDEVHVALRLLGQPVQVEVDE
ncbi:UPF1 [Symbiodinium natans]|uniref:UPF1 protein n=1 Tax=Symbiodinium natans TaxID=878477 RepID=A0A812V6W1_9DINO|nr:UPF1 [Symbiodinium natans]